MAKKVTITVDADASALAVSEGRVFLGTKTEVKFDGWTPDDGCRAVLTLFAGGQTPVAAATTDDEGRTWLDLTGAEVRKAFHGELARHAFKAFLNQRQGADGDFLPDVEAEGTMWVEWSPEVFEVTDDGSAIAALQGPAGPMGPQGVAGADGEKGEKGDKGDQGERGEKGEKGEKGEQGEKGEKGDVPSIVGKEIAKSPTQRQIAEALKTIWAALGGTITT